MNPELVVEIKGDLSNWDASMRKVKNDLHTINGTFSKSTPSVDQFSRQIDSAGGSVGNFLKGYLALETVMRAGAAFLTATKDVQKFENQLKVASGTQQDYGKNVQFLEGLAAKYNKNVLDLGANFAQLTIATRGTNLEGEKTERLFAAVTASSAALQMSVDDTNGTFRAFIQMVSKGNVQAEELRGQLGERLYGAFNLAAKSMGVTTQELNKMLERGEVLASDLLPKLTVELENTFGADAQKNADNLGSNIEYASGQASMFIAELGKTSGITDSLNDMAKSMGEILVKLRQLNKEGGIVDGFFDRMFTRPGRSFGTDGRRALSAQEVADKNLEAIMKRMNGTGGASTRPFSSATSNVLSDSYGAQFDIRETNHKTESKLRKQAEDATKKADQEVARWASEQIRLSNERIAQALFDAKIEQQMHYANRAGQGVGMIGNTGTVRKFGMDQDKAHTEFTNPVTGDGSASNYDHIIANMDNAIAQIQARYKLLQNATSSVAASLDQGIKSAFESTIASSIEGFGSLAGALATGNADLEDVGNTFMGIMANLFDNIGQALSAYAATQLAAEISIKSMSVPGALIGAALAFGAAAVARASMQKSSSQAFYTGGIVQGRGGIDNIHARVSAGEMILNKGQQSRMFGILDGAYNGRILGDPGSYSSGGSGELTGELRGVRVPSGDIGFSARVGEKKNNYFRSKRR